MNNSQLSQSPQSLFTAEDLQLNQQGQLSSSQKEFLQEDVKRLTKKTEKLIYVGIIFAIIVALIRLLQSENFQENIYVLAILGLGLVIYYFGMKKYFDKKREKFFSSDVLVKSVSGTVEITSLSGNSESVPSSQSAVSHEVSTMCLIKIGDVKFYTDKNKILSHLENNKSYIFYYIMYGSFPILLSWEKI